MRTWAVVAALVVTANLATAAPRPHDEVGVTIASSGDESPGVLDAHARKRHGEIVRRALLDVLRRSGADVLHAGIAPRQIDVAVVAWRVTPTEHRLDVSAELRIVICDEHGKMLSLMTGRASISVSSRSASLEALREQVLAEAVGGMARSLQSQFDRATS